MHESAICNLPKTPIQHMHPTFSAPSSRHRSKRHFAHRADASWSCNSLAINTTQFGQFGFEASNDIRVGIQVEVLRRRHVYRHRLINLLAPCTNSREASPVVRPSGCPLHVAMGRTRGLGRSCVVANANEGPARHSRTRGHRWNGEHDVHHRVEVDEKENGRQGVGDECNGEEQNTVAEQEPPQVRPAWSDDLFRVSDTTFAFANLLTTHQANCGHD